MLDVIVAMALVAAAQDGLVASDRCSNLLADAKKVDELGSRPSPKQAELEQAAAVMYRAAASSCNIVTHDAAREASRRRDELREKILARLEAEPTSCAAYADGLAMAVRLGSKGREPGRAKEVSEALYGAISMIELSCKPAPLALSGVIKGTDALAALGAN